MGLKGKAVAGAASKLHSRLRERTRQGLAERSPTSPITTTLQSPSRSEITCCLPSAVPVASHHAPSMALTSMSVGEH